MLVTMSMNQREFVLLHKDGFLLHTNRIVESAEIISSTLLNIGQDHQNAHCVSDEFTNSPSKMTTATGDEQSWPTKSSSITDQEPTKILHRLKPYEEILSFERNLKEAPAVIKELRSEQMPQINQNLDLVTKLQRRSDVLVVYLPVKLLLL
ncbi:hypothetical protein KIN20_014522 [Parelaphostrongylus tenuis]|uniref:Uncharacterized protein n=1 Tax=Parelaphostrongylus tenuis TaxID=148309 RepID=A0AAD5QNH2_PARTN|nr:hypothetical protein KIN20_014522 [Parelaphostrongylus tenuis]